MTKKARFIQKLTSLSGKEKAQVIAFFNKYPNYESLIDWNSRNLRYSDFERIFALAEKSVNKQKIKAKEDPRLLFEGYNCEILCQTEDFIVVVPLDWDCAVFFNSFNCGGEGAKWCIGDKNNSNHWYKYAQDKMIFALVYFIKKQFYFGKKIIFQYNTEYPEEEIFLHWFQNNKGTYSDFLFKYYKILSKIWMCNLWTTIFRKHIKIISQVFKIIYNDLSKVGKTLWEKIYIPEYCIKDSSLIKWYNSKSKEINIPSGITAIEHYAFGFCEELKTINIPNSVTYIGEDAFYFCRKLKAINLPENITSINKGTFTFCQKLKTIKIPDNVTFIEEGAFNNCYRLETINITDKVTFIGDEVFRYCKSIKEINLPNGITAIGKETFFNCEKLKYINFPNKLTSIGNEAFSGCVSLTTITIPESVKTIGKKAFYGCINLESVNIPKSTKVARNAFKGCRKLKKINRYGVSLLI